MELVLVTVLSGAAVLLCAGQILVAAGGVRSRNAVSAFLRGICGLAVATLTFVFLGQWLLPHMDIGLSPGLAMGGLHGVLLAMIAAMIAVPAVSERSTFAAPMALAVAVAFLVTPLASRWVWGGWLARMGFVDVAGAGGVHFGGGMVALVAAAVLGGRTGKYNRDGSTSIIPGHQGPYIALGTLLMLVGWLPYMTASVLALGMEPATAAVVMLQTLVAASAGAVCAAAASYLRTDRTDPSFTCFGLIGGLVAITAAGPLVTPFAALLLGALAGLLVPMAVVFIDRRLHFDDPAAMAATHITGALVGLFGGVLLLSGASASQRFKLIWVQLAGVIAIGLLAILVTAAATAILWVTAGVRVSEDEEFDGLDLAQHDVNGYPDFQQTTIKSYHTREM